MHVAAYIEQLSLAAQTVKQRLAALRALFDWLVVGQVLPVNPAASVRGPRHSVKVGKTPVLSAQEVRDLIAAIETDTIIGRRDRAVIGAMVYTFARVGAVTRMQLEDVYVQRRRLWGRLHEKGGKLHDMPCHHNLEDWLHDYIDGADLTGAAGILFRSAKGADRRTVGPTDVAGRRVPDDRAPCERGRHRDPDRLPQFPRHRHHRVPAQRRQAGDRAADGQPRVGSDDGPV